MTEKIITVDTKADGFPSLTNSLMIKCPTFKDLRQARQRYPQTSNLNGGLSYSTEELLLALCFLGVDGKEFPPNPRDAMDRLEILPIADYQYLREMFKEAFLLTPELAKEARSLAQDKMFSMPPQLSYSVDKLSSPSGQVSFTWNRPNTGTQFATDKLHKGIPTHGCTFEEYLFACCVTHINDEPVEACPDPIVRLDPFGPDDIGFMLTVFINMNVLDDEGSEKAKKSGISMREKRFAKESVTKKKGTETPPTEN